MRSLLSVDDWRTAVEAIAREHGLPTHSLEPYEKGETIVWRAGEHVIKLTTPECAFQIEAEVGCLTAVQGKLSVRTPRLRAHGELSGWPYVVLERIGGVPLGQVWPELEYDQRRRVTQRIAGLCRELHALPPQGFPTGWPSFWRSCNTNVGERHAARGESCALTADVDRFLAKIGPLDEGPLVPLHTEILDQHVYVYERSGKIDLSGLIDFADARLGAAPYEFGAPIEFILRGERGLLREFLLAYGVPEASLTPSYSETLLAWGLCHRFSTLQRLLTALEPRVPSSLEELAAMLYGVEAA